MRHDPPGDLDMDEIKTHQNSYHLATHIKIKVFLQLLLGVGTRGLEGLFESYDFLY